MATRDYTDDRLTVHWDSTRCIHVAACLRGAGAVFDTEQRPWVQLEQGETDTIVAAVEACPSGALTYTRHDGGPQEVPPSPPQVTARPDGPLMVRGAMTVRDGRSGEDVDCVRATLCRCGGSSNQPFCDNSHRSNGFTDNPKVVPSYRAEAEDPTACGPTDG